jgi:proteasome assembly chaperone (PAC2) family protein
MSDKDNLIFVKKPILRKPYILCGFNGWFNGGDVSVGGINYFIKQFKGTKFAEISASHYHIYQIPGVESLRPVFKMKDGLIVETDLPKNEFYFAINPASENDLIFFLGDEPNLNWEEYASSVVNLACEFGAVRLLALGGLFESTPYTREPMISCTCTDAKTKAEMEKYNVTFSNREGIATFNQMLLYTCKKKGLEGVGFTARAPYYPDHDIAIAYSPKSIKAVLIRLNHMMRLNIDFDELDEAIRDLEGKLNSIRRQNLQFNTYMEQLEKEYIERIYQEPLDISPNEAIRFAEEFLKNNKDKGPGSKE